MPSTLVHVGLAALLGTALLADRFDARAIAVVMAAAAFPDLDTFIGLWVMEGAHRAVFHNLVFSAIAVVVIVWDGRWRDRSWVRGRWGDGGYRVALVAVVAGWIVAGVLLDAFYNGVNLFWPLYDQFIDLSGFIIVSDQRGFVQTFIELERTVDGLSIGDAHTRGGTADTHYYTGVDPGPNAPPGVERIFPIADDGVMLVVMVAGYLTAGIRIWERR